MTNFSLGKVDTYLDCSHETKARPTYYQPGPSYDSLYDDLPMTLAGASPQNEESEIDPMFGESQHSIVLCHSEASHPYYSDNSMSEDILSSGINPNDLSSMEGNMNPATDRLRRGHKDLEDKIC